MWEGMLSLLEWKCWTKGDLSQPSLGFPVHQQAKDTPKGLGGYLKSLSSLKSLFNRTVLFPNRDCGPLFHRWMCVNHTKRGVSSFELLLSLLNVLFNLVPLSGQLWEKVVLPRWLLQGSSNFEWKVISPCNCFFSLVPDNDCNLVGQSSISKQHDD